MLNGQRRRSDGGKEAVAIAAMTYVRETSGSTAGKTPAYMTCTPRNSRSEVGRDSTPQRKMNTAER